MNDDKVPAGKYSVSTNRNFEGRQVWFKNTVSFLSWQQQQQLLEN
jgi:homoaconitase/3-isopropylmalate dehydratase large subunit